MTGTTVDTPADLLALAVPSALGASDWLLVDQKRINQFADATGDYQWIHVDPERAASGPFGSTIAHGYLTLSLANLLLPDIIAVRRTAMGINYGCDRVRFPAPVPAGSMIRGRGELIAARPLDGDGAQITVRVTIDIQGGDKPACVVDAVSRFYA